MAANDRPIIIKKITKVAGGHHGGAWKVAYADFVTAMMAFFLLMWLINTTTPEQKQGIADYFAPASVSPSTSGSGQPFGGTTPGQDGVQGSGDASMVRRLAPSVPEDNNDTEQVTPASSSDATDAPEVTQSAMAQAQQRREDALFQSAAMSLRQAMQSMPELAELSNQVIMDVTPEGLRIQLIDQEGRPMFAPGAAEPNPRAVTLINAIAAIAERLPNRVSISGHTDSGPTGSGNYTNWNLSADRANAARAVMQEAGISDDRIYEVRGKAGSEPLYPDDPYMPGNRRISIVLLREAPILPAGHEL
ncbi:flagellar motor protein MotB [Maricaulis sp.]|uniref:flagellar motor protein MotB n=1 Tax=Maricaulis sp. TaxID=1486257 RepID=UPI003A8EB85D